MVKQYLDVRILVMQLIAFEDHNAEQIFNSVEVHLTNANIAVVKKSALLQNPPYGGVAKNQFTNAVWEIACSVSPNELIELISVIELFEHIESAPAFSRAMSGPGLGFGVEGGFNQFH